MYFPLNFVKFLRMTISCNAYGRLLLRFSFFHPGISQELYLQWNIGTCLSVVTFSTGFRPFFQWKGESGEAFRYLNLVFQSRGTKPKNCYFSVSKLNILSSIMLWSYCWTYTQVCRSRKKECRFRLETKYFPKMPKNSNTKNKFEFPFSIAFYFMKLDVFHEGLQ